MSFRLHASHPVRVPPLTGTIWTIKGLSAGGFLRPLEVFGQYGGILRSGFFQRLEECSVGIFVGASVGWDEIGRGGVTGKADLLYDAAVGGPAGEFGAV